LLNRFKNHSLKKIFFAFLCVLAAKANAQIADTGKTGRADTIKKGFSATPDAAKALYHKPGTFIAPAVLVGYGLLSFVVTPVRNVDYYVKARIARSDPNYNSKAADYLQLSPIVLVYGLNLAGDEGQNRFVDRTALLALSGGILTLTDGLKYVAHRRRPYGTDPLSFPSGHTGAAFMAAEFLAQEYSEKSPLYGALGYTIATTTGVLRLYGRAHWFSDCVAGAGFGMLSTKVAYLVYPHIRKAFMHKDKHGRSTMVMPTYQDGVPGLSFAMQL
jgi:membrane-associated phospholipid phosphatase